MPYLLPTTCVVLAILLFLSWRTHLIARSLQKEKHHLEKQNLNEQYSALEKEHKIILNAFDDALIITDAKSNIKLANRSAKELCNRNSLRGKTVTQAFLNQPITDAIKKALATGNACREKLVIPSGSFGSSSSLEESSWILDVAPLELENTKDLYRVILRNITAEHKTDQIKREFVANASHELRTPLSIINGYLENLLEDGMLEETEMATRFLTTMQKHGSRLSELVEDMLSISKLETGDSSLLDISEFRVADVFEDIRDRLISMTREHNSSITIDLPSDDLTLSGDRFYWEQIFFNLTENALKQNCDKTIEVQLAAKVIDGHLQFTVRDTGKGIPAAHLPYIFNRFYRVEKHHSQNVVKGTGLGLAIVKHAVELQGGEISATSIPGEETIFTIELPS